MFHFYVALFSYSGWTTIIWYLSALNVRLFNGRYLPTASVPVATGFTTGPLHPSSSSSSPPLLPTPPPPSSQSFFPARRSNHIHYPQEIFKRNSLQGVSARSWCQMTLTRRGGNQDIISKHKHWYTFPIPLAFAAMDLFMQKTRFTI